MPLTKVGLNVSNIAHPNNLTLDLPSTASDYIAEIPRKANEVTGGYFGLGALITLFILLVKLLYDEYEGFRYSLIRSISLGSMICTIFGIYALNFGYFTEYYHVVIFFVIALVSTIIVVIEDR
jgi:hypothetical protein